MRWRKSVRRCRGSFLLNAIRGNAKIGIITNGFSALQQVRLERTGLRDYFDLLVISEEVGVAKPNKKIFDYALEQAGNPDRSRVLMVSDTAESDILGGINAGLATCWLNAHNREQPEGIAPTDRFFVARTGAAPV